MADKSISSFNRVSDPISSSSKLVKETNENTGNGGPPPPTIRSKESEQKILNRQQAARSSPTQTQTGFIATALPQTSAPIESAELISNEKSFPPVPVCIKFPGKDGRMTFENFDNVSDLNQLRSEIKQRCGIEGEFSLVGAGEQINDMPQFHKAWRLCDGRFFMILPRKTLPSQQSDSKVHSHMTTWPTQTQPSFKAAPSPQTVAPVESAKLISNETNFPPVLVCVRFPGKDGRMTFKNFDNVSDLNQLRSEIKQRCGIEGEFSLVGAGKHINDTSQLHDAWPRCEGTFYIVLNNKT